MADRNTRREGQYGSGRRQQSDRFRGTGDWERDENYFGSGRQGYGDGITEYNQGRSMATGWRDASFDRDEGQDTWRYGDRDYGRRYSRGYDRGYESDYDRGSYGSDYDQSYTSDYPSSYGRSPSDYGRSSYSGGSFGDYRQSASRGYTGTGGYDRSESYRGGGRYGYRYPDSEYGFATDRERMDDRGWWDRASDEVASWFGDEEATRRREMDERRGVNGRYRGRGPRGYTRSDDRIKEDINDRLTYHAFIDASDIDVEVDGGNVILSGNVNSRYEKRYAEDVAEEVNGVNNVENRLRVESSSQQRYTSDTSTTTDTTTAGRTRAASQS